MNESTRFRSVPSVVGRCAEPWLCVEPPAAALYRPALIRQNLTHDHVTRTRDDHRDEAHHYLRYPRMSTAAQRRRVSQLRIVAQRLVGEPWETPGEVARAMMCLQGQDWPGVLTSLALRTRSRSLADVHAAFNSGELVRSWPQRGTLHVLPAQDIGWYLGLTALPRLLGQEKRRVNNGIESKHIDDVRALTLELLRSGELGGSMPGRATTPTGAAVPTGDAVAAVGAAPPTSNSAQPASNPTPLPSGTPNSGTPITGTPITGSRGTEIANTPPASDLVQPPVGNPLTTNPLAGVPNVPTASNLTPPAGDTTSPSPHGIRPPTDPTSPPPPPKPSVFPISRDVLIGAWLERGALPTKDWAYYLLHHLCIEGVLVQGPVGPDGNQMFVLAEDWIDDRRTLDRPGAVNEVVARYLTSRGPASRRDINWWSQLPLREIDAAIENCKPDLTGIDVDGQTYWVHNSVLERAESLPVSRSLLVLPGFDELILGYGSRWMTIPEQRADALVPGNNGVFRKSIILGGTAVGFWRPGRMKPVVELFAEPTQAFEKRLDRAFAALPA